jgi:hypothetical protein
MLPARSFPWTQVWTQTHKHSLDQTIPNKQRRSQSLVRSNSLRLALARNPFAYKGDNVCFWGKADISHRKIMIASSTLSHRPI